MARPREFDREAALQEAIKVFCSHGFAGSSTETLLDAMGISRQSLYDTYGDKRRLYLEALGRYNAESVGRILDSLDSLDARLSPLDRLEAALVAFASRPMAEAARGCMGVMATCEFGKADAEVGALSKASSKVLLPAVEAVIAEAQAEGEADAALDSRAAAEFINATLSGMKVAARGGASPETLRGIARMAIRSLR